MSRFAILNRNGNKVINVVEGDPVWCLAQGFVACPDNTTIDDLYNGTMFSKPVPNAQKAKRAIKQTVRELLRRTDWTQVPDNLNQNKRDAWQTWRQSIRALIAQAEIDPFTIVFSDPPGDLDEDGL